MEGIGDEGLLSLGLAFGIDSGCERRVKRKRREGFKALLDRSECCEGKIFSLFEKRDMMLKKDQRRRKEVSSGEDGKGLHLIHLLLVSATSLEKDKLDSALENLMELYQHVSLNGDSVKRVAAYFADGLVARLLTCKSPFYEMIMKEPNPEEEFLAFVELYKVSPYYQFAHFTANQAIIEAYEREEETNNRTLHVVDLDVAYGFQWPSLMQSLSEKATVANRVSLRITGFGRNIEELQETEARLVGYAKSFRKLVFEFQGFLRGSSRLKTIIRTTKKETLVVNLVFYLNTLCSFTHLSDMLKSIYMLNPSVVVLVEQEGGGSPRSFLSRFMEFLHYFAAMFDSLDDFLPLDSLERLRIEKNHLGKEIKRLMNFDKDDTNYPKYERTEIWKGRMQSHGFSSVKLSSKSIIQAKLLVKIRSHYCPMQFSGENGGFTVFERDDAAAISLAWQDKCLVTASSWQCVS